MGSVSGTYFAELLIHCEEGKDAQGGARRDAAAR
jgi:hypothetical protein